MSRVGPTGRLAVLAVAVVLVFALAGSGVGTDARLVDSEVATVPVVVFGAAPDDPQSGLAGTPLTLTFEGLTPETADWPDGFAAATDEASTASFSVASRDAPTESTESTESTEPAAAPQYVVRLDSVGPDSVQFTLAGGEQTATTVAVDGALLAAALDVPAFDPADVELRVGGVVTGYDTTADGTVQFRTPDWAEQRVTFRVVEQSSPGDPIPESPTAPAEEPTGTTEEAPAEETPTEEASTDDVPTEESPAAETPTGETPPDDSPAEETPTEESPADETTTEEPPTEEAPAEETPTEEAPAEETSTEKEVAEETSTIDSPAEETPTEASPTDTASTEETPTEDAPTETTAEESSTDSQKTASESSTEDTETTTEPESTGTTEAEATPETAEPESSQTPDGAGE
jgi:hypothetical protein